MEPKENEREEKKEKGCPKLVEREYLQLSLEEGFFKFDNSNLIFLFRKRKEKKKKKREFNLFFELG